MEEEPVRAEKLMSAGAHRGPPFGFSVYAFRFVKSFLGGRLFRGKMNLATFRETARQFKEPRRGNELTFSTGNYENR